MTDTAYADWIGRQTLRTDILSDRLIAHYRATLAPWLYDADVPLGIHWCLSPEVLDADHLGPDGHLKLGIALPDLGLVRRMWAGGEISFHGDLTSGAQVTRTGIVGDIAFKEGGSGRLGFVTLNNSYVADGTEVIAERQDIVYRAAPAPGAAAPSTPPAPELGAPLARFDLTPDPVLLFRFSALTFNGHRIHYDQPYATGAESYAGLVVHGPLQAILMLNLAARALGRAPARFRYRGLSPLIAGRTVAVEAFAGEGGALDLRVREDGGVVTMTGQAD
jgi:3-methylfumaryl-CoA hydratase